MSSSTWLDSVLPGLLSDRDLLLVFPSQAVADAWALAAPRRFGLGAVEAMRFLGWDRYKEGELTAPRAERPANELSRLLWAADFLERHRKGRLLERLAGPGDPGPAFARFFSTLPPALDRVSRLIQGKEDVKDQGLADLLVLRRDYGAFLESHGLFEPAWTGSRKAPGRKAAILAPELMEDFSDYAQDLEASSLVSLYSLPPGAGTPGLLGFETSYEELRWTFMEIGALLDSGVEADDIVVSLPDFEHLGAYAQRAAEHAGVPVALKGGTPLSDSPYGRLLSHFSSLASGGFDFESLKALLLDRFVVWKEEAAAQDLLRFGVDYHAYASYTEGGQLVDIWLKTFEVVGGHADLKTWYLKLKKAVLAIAGAASFTSLRAALFAFRRDFLDEARWAIEEPRISRVMAELEGLARAEAELGMRIPGSVLDLFIGRLEAKTYVAQGRSGGGWVKVLPYRLGALHPAGHHFVLGASQDGVKVSYASLPFLRADQKEALGEADQDASEAFLRAYGLSGPAVGFSYAVEAFGGWAVPHAHFSSPGAQAPGLPPDYAALREASPERAEARAWREALALPGRLLSFQKACFAAAAPHLGDKAKSYAKQPASAAALAALGPRIRTAEGKLRLSTSTLHEYLACPFAWLLARGLRLEDEATGVGFFDARLAGNMAHQALQDLLGAMGELGPIEATKAEAYLGLAEKAVDEVLPFFAATEGPFLKPMFSAYAPLLKDRLKRHVLALLDEGGTEAGDLELALSKDYPGRNLVLEGRIDRLGVLAGQGPRESRPRAIVDYKKRRLPAQAELSSSLRERRGEDGAGETEAAQPSDLGDYQMAAYISLCLEAGHEVGRASYWSIEDAKDLVVIGAEGLRPPGDWEPELEALEAAVDATARGIEAGGFTMAPPSSKACEGCPWKAICRERYATE